MNKLYFLLLALVLAAPLGVRAQQVDSVRQRLNTVFAPLDKSQVPTRYLEKYGVRLLLLRKYNGALTDSSLCDLATPRYLRARLASARISAPNSTLR